MFAVEKVNQKLITSLSNFLGTQSIYIRKNGPTDVGIFIDKFDISALKN